MTYYLFSITLGVLIGWLYRISKPTDAQRQRVAERLGWFCLAVLLPVHIATAGVRAAMLGISELLWQNALWGAVTCAVVFLCLHVVSRLTGTQQKFVVFQGATFAGGGRALAIAGILAPFVAPYLDYAEMDIRDASAILIDAFVIFDLGYWLFFVNVIYGLVMPRSYGSKSPKKGGEFLGVVFVAQFVAAMVTLIAANIPPEKLLSLPGVETLLPQARWVLSAVIVALAAIYSVLLFERNTLSSIKTGIGLIVAGRLAGMALVACIVYFVAEGFTALIALPLVIFLLAPPSSFIPMMLRRVGAPIDEETIANTIGAAWTLVFAVLGVTALVVGIVLSIG